MWFADVTLGAERTMADETAALIQVESIWCPEENTEKIIRRKPTTNGVQGLVPLFLFRPRDMRDRKHSLNIP